MDNFNIPEATQDQQGTPIPQGEPVESARNEHPERIDRYRIEKVLGQGGFGLVYLAIDEQLDRRVAVKVPHAKLILKTEDAKAYLTEARTVANLDHPSIVPVHDVGSTDECPCYVVSKYIEGTDLSSRIKESRLKYTESAELLATVAEALHYAHKQGLVHRDVKPGNILIGTDGKPHVVDFGLALREENIGKGPKFAGTPAYMSPEQARGEGHRVDGRSDIFSLGAVFYELLVGRQPFRGDTQADLLEQVTSFEPRPVRQHDDHIPKELERICHKSLAKRASERYSTAKDLAEDLRHFLVEQTVPQSGTLPENMAVLASETQTSTSDSTSEGSTDASSGSTGIGSFSDSQPIKIVPKGLRSFDAHDADFFLELLPGARDRSGLPDSLRFWKSTIEETDPDNTFTVGLIYGPSGCGKSSLIKAGLLPRLSEDIISVYVEATPDETEPRLLHGLQKRCAALTDKLSLKDTLTALRRGQGVPVGKKVLVVLDQFEQWLHAKKEEVNTELVQALRQCDGGRVQCIVMVRDDFWMAATRFMDEMEVDLLKGQNMQPADLFDPRHAKKVLAAFGRAFGALPAGQVSKDQKLFLEQSIAGLAEEGKVICVRLALYAEMMRGKPWTPSTLREVGGIRGVGVTFLEDTFSSQTANPKARLHQKAARAVLRALLPKSGTNIKGEMKSYDELLEASGYARRKRDFDSLIKLLDSEIRLITPTDPEGMETDEDAVSQSASDQKYYQLTHDYLVHSLRDWLTRKQKESRRGRAELRLADRAVLWNSKPESRHLPSWWEYLNIRLLTSNKAWTKPQRQMMAKAGRVHALRWGAVLVMLFAAGFAANRYVSSQKATAEARQRENNRQQAESLVETVLVAPTTAFPYAMEDLRPFREHAVPILQQRFDDAALEPRQRTHAALALAEFGQAESRMVVDSIAAADPEECSYFVAALRDSRESALESLLAVAAQAEAKQDWHHKARLAIVALQLGDASLADDMCRLRADPTQRTVFIDVFPSWHENLQQLKQHVADAGQGSLRSGICLAMGSVGDVSRETMSAWKPLLTSWYTNQPDSGTHSAARWALQQWEVPLPPIAPTQQPADGFDWHVNSLGMTMIRIPAGEFERPIRGYGFNPIVGKQIVHITRDFQLGSCEITVELFRSFINDANYRREKPAILEFEDTSLSPSVGHPVQMVDWHDVVMFCNWLSWKEGLVPNYKLAKGNTDVDGEGQAYDVEIVEESNGYRLPTEAEWEYACRARSNTTYLFGDDPAILGHYGVWAANADENSRSVGGLMCNGWGLFDMHGNVFEWCWDRFDIYAAGNLFDPNGPCEATNPSMRMRTYRSGCWKNPAGSLETSFRWAMPPTFRMTGLGFRVGRSLQQ